jgi:CHAT domain-containing protein
LEIVALAAAVVTGALLVPRQESSLRDRVVMAAHYRATPGRLLGETSWRPWRARAADGSFEPEVAALLRPNKDPRELDGAVFDLLRGDFDRAIAKFELASHTAPDGHEALTDLSAAYLARFEATHDCLDLLRAIDAADRGLAMQPMSRELRFNRAIALSRLGTRLIAEAAWRQIAIDDEQGKWRSEATAQLADLRQPGVEEQWARLLPRIESPTASPLDIATVVSQLPSTARAFAEEQLLPRWASAMAAGDSAAAERSLRLASGIGDVLRRTRGEELLADAVSAIRRTIDEGSPAQREALVRGLQNFAVGVAQYKEHNLKSAETPLMQAVTDLRAAGNPLQYWARFYLAIGVSYRLTDRGLGTLDRLLVDFPNERYPALVGRIEWIAGTAEKLQGRIQSSVRRYERSATALRQAGGETASAFTNVLLAESYTVLGEHAMAWQTRLAAFRQVPLVEEPRRRIAMWIEAKEALVHQGNLKLARPFVDEAVANAGVWGKGLGRSVAYLDRASYRAETGAQEGALADLRVARAAIAEMENSSLRDQEISRELITAGLCYQMVDPARAARLLQEGLQRQGATGRRFAAIRYTTALAAAQIASGDPAAGADSLERALSLFEDVRATVEDPVSRMQAFRQAQPAFDRLIDLRTSSLPADDEAVFALAERSRARVLLELRAQGPHTPFARLDDLERLLPRGVALVSYVVLTDRILAWVVEQGRVRRVTLGARRAELEAAIDTFRLELVGGDGARIRKAGMPLYDYLIRPLALSPGSEEPLIIVPDRVLTRLPFPALVDRGTGQYLIEQRAISIAPSATMLLRTDRGAAPRLASKSALVLGVSRPGTWRGRSLPPLPQAEREAEAVAALYPAASLLRGAQATRQNFSAASISSDVIHFAGHAVVDLEAPRRSVLLFAGDTKDGLEPLSLGELLDAGLRETRLVVLAACGTQDSLADDREGLLGLAGAFIAAGVAEVVASPLDVDDESADAVMVAFHRHYRRDQRAVTAFRNSVLELLRSRSGAVASPAAWGGFTVIQGSL